MFDQPSFHEAFSRALAGSDEALMPWWPEVRRGLSGLSVYRNTVAKGLTDAIAASFPTVEAVVGPDWLREAAMRFVANTPPVSAVLVDYGAAFPEWLTTFEPARDLPFLADLARLDRLWTEAHLASDAEPLDPKRLARLTPEAFDRISLIFVPSARLARFETTVADLWRALRHESGLEAFELSQEPQSILIWRPAEEVETKILPAATADFLESCQRGETLTEAATLAGARIAPDMVSALFADLLSCRVFAALPE